MEEWLKSVYSDSTREFVSNNCPEQGEKICIRIRMRKNESIRSVYLRTREFGAENLTEMRPDEEWNGLVYYRTEIIVNDKRFQYQFYLVTDNRIYYYTQYRITGYVPEESHDFVILAGYKKAAWLENAVFYQIFPDRFFRGNPDYMPKNGEYFYQGYYCSRVDCFEDAPAEFEEGHNLDFYGGDLEGIIQKLDYLQKLGINAIYLNPIFLSPSTHRYDSLDYFRIEPHLGGEEALVRLGNELHKRNMHIILDISINHTSSEHRWFNRDGSFYGTEEGAWHNQQSPFREFYFFREDNSYDTWCGVQTMPKLNYTSEKLRDCIYRREDSALQKWISPPYDMDGWRFDVADCLGRNRMADLHREVLDEIHKYLKKRKPEAFLLAEDWADCSEDLQGTAWDSTMNYFGCTRPVREFFGCTDLFQERNERLRAVKPKMTAASLRKRIEQFQAKLPGIISYQMFNLLDSHDVIRFHNYDFISDLACKAAILILFTLPGMPCVYYGDEVALDGRTNATEGCRYPMDWNWQQDEKAQERFSLYQKMIQLRTGNRTLQCGGFRIQELDRYVIGIFRFTRQELILLVCSSDEKERMVSLPVADFGLMHMDAESDWLGNPVELFREKDSTLMRVLPHQSYFLIMKLS